MGVAAEPAPPEQFKAIVADLRAVMGSSQAILTELT